SHASFFSVCSYCAFAFRVLLSFPTRRSSDLCVFLFDVFAAVSAFFTFPGPGVDEGPPFFAAYLDVGDVHYLFLVVVVCVVGGSGSCFVGLSCLAGRDRWQTDATRSTRPKLFASAALGAVSGRRPPELRSNPR